MTKTSDLQNPSSGGAGEALRSSTRCGMRRATHAHEWDDMPSTNVVNLDALIRRADLATPGEVGEEMPSLPITQLAAKGFLYPSLRKPDFQRETASWSPEQVADLVITFANRDLIPAVILWRAGQSVFVIDGAHRLSALVAWVHNDYGDGDISRRFFHDVIPEEQREAARKARDLIHTAIGSYRDHEIAIEYPDNARVDVAERAARIGWHLIPAQWIHSADHEKAEKSFFRINQGGTKIDSTERRILSARDSATALSSRAILRAGTGHNYWKRFEKSTTERIETLGGSIYELFFSPSISLPIKTLDLPVAGQGYGPHVLPFLFDLINLVNDVGVSDSSNKNLLKDEKLPKDDNGSLSVRYLTKVHATLARISSVHASSLGLHPALYFYNASGGFQPGSLLSFVTLFKDWDTQEFRNFTKIRADFEAFLLTRRGMTEAIRALGSGARSRPRVVALYKELIAGLLDGNTLEDLENQLAERTEFAFLFNEIPEIDGKLSAPGKKFARETKGAAYLRDALPRAFRCATCGGILHINAMQTGHQTHRRDGGTANINNAMMQHPFCNSTVNQ